MKKSLLLLFLSAAPLVLLFSQAPASSLIHVNNVKAVVNAVGAFFTDGPQGQFIPVESGADIVTAPETPEMAGLMLYPNPADDVCTLESKGAPLENIVITDMLGRKVREINLDKKVLRYDFSISDLAAGGYVVKALGKAMLLAVQR